MKKIFIVALVLISCFSSCSRNDEINSTSRLSGIYTEVSPMEGRTQLAFIGGSKVIKVSEGSNISEEFIYEIIGNRIKFTSVGNDPQISELHFNRVNNSTFEVENLYVSIPENPEVYMLFRKIGMTD